MGERKIEIFLQQYRYPIQRISIVLDIQNLVLGAAWDLVQSSKMKYSIDFGPTIVLGEV